MRQETLRWPSSRRWVIVVMVIVALVILGQLSFAATDRQPSLGLQAEISQGQMIISRVQPAGRGWVAGIRPGDSVMLIDGLPVSERDDPAAITTAAKVSVQSASGRTITLAIADDLGFSSRLRTSFLVIAISFMVVGSLIFLLTPHVVSALVALSFGASAAAALLAAIATSMGLPWAFLVEFIAVIAFSASTFLLFLVFPVNRLTYRWRRWMAITCLAVNLVLILLYVLIFTFNSAAYEILRPISFAAVTVNLAGGVALMLEAMARPGLVPAETRRSAGLVAVGTFAGVAPLCALSLVPRILGLEDLVAPEIAILSVVLLPVSLGAAALNRQFFGISRIVSRGLVALIVWTGLLTGYTVALYGLTTMIDPAASLTSHFGMAMASVALVAATFWPLQHRIRRLLERVLFRDVYEYAETLRDLSSEIVHLASVDAIASHVLSRLGETLDLTWTAIVLDAAEPPAPTYRWGTYPSGNELPALAEAGLDGNSASYQVVPLVADGMSIGTLAIGPKRYDVELLPEDQRLIATLAPLVATSLQSALLIRRLEIQVAVLEDRERTLAALSTRLLQIQEEERRRVAYEIHDELAQVAASTHQHLQALARQHPPESPEEQAKIDRAMDLAQRTVREARRMVANLRPTVL
ncbi:MAG TPA: histidine kinase, partial [Nitrolancea sp.]|nr:histidine kinase [Nitrolancea sp.]